MVFGLLCGSALAAPPARVLVLPGGPDEAAAASLAEALRIQIGAQGSVSVGDVLMGSNSDFIRLTTFNPNGYGTCQ